MQEEIWKDVVGYEGLYKVSNLGRIKSLYDCNRYRKIYREKILKQQFKDKKNLYLCVTLNKNHKSKNFRVHRLVAQAFISNTENKTQVNHINGIKTDNRVENLEWSTPKENMQRAYRTNLNKGSNLGKTGGRNHLAKGVNQYDLNGNFIKSFLSIVDASNETKINKGNISCCCTKRGYYKTAGGYIWKFNEVK